MPARNGVVEFDINKLPPAVCHKLDDYVKDVLNSRATSDAFKTQSQPVYKPAEGDSDSDSSSESSISSQGGDGAAGAPPVPKPAEGKASTKASELWSKMNGQ